MLLCKDCRHVLPSEANGQVDENSRCSKFKSAPNLVTGEQRQAFAENARHESYCGSEARFFEARE